jgi:hypothetical protein
VDVSSLAGAAIAMQQSLVATQIQMAVLKQSMEIESQSVLQLLEGAAQVAANPAHLGNLIDTLA